MPKSKTGLKEEHFEFAKKLEQWVRKNTKRPSQAIVGTLLVAAHVGVKNLKDVDDLESFKAAMVRDLEHFIDKAAEALLLQKEVEKKSKQVENTFQ